MLARRRGDRFFASLVSARIIQGACIYRGRRGTAQPTLDLGIPFLSLKIIFAGCIFLLYEYSE